MARIPVSDPGDFDRLWDTATDVLRAHNLWPDRQDRAAGIITTFPDTSANWFEFWRPFPSTGYHKLEANVQTIRRQARIQIEPAGEGECNMTVQVDVERYCTVERQATNSASAFQIFGAKLPTTEGRMEPRQAGSYWEPLGRDAAMETALVDRILRRFGAGSRLARAEIQATQPANPP